MLSIHVSAVLVRCRAAAPPPRNRHAPVRSPGRAPSAAPADDGAMIALRTRSL
jgi:hypothetical protein